MAAPTSPYRTWSKLGLKEIWRQHLHTASVSQAQASMEEAPVNVSEGICPVPWRVPPAPPVCSQGVRVVHSLCSKWTGHRRPSFCLVLDVSERGFCSDSLQHLVPSLPPGGAALTTVSVCGAWVSVCVYLCGLGLCVCVHMCGLEGGIGWVVRF